MIITRRLQGACLTIRKFIFLQIRFYMMMMIGGQDIGQFSTFSNKSSIWIAELRDQNRKVVGLERSVLGKTNDF